MPNHPKTSFSRYPMDVKTRNEQSRRFVPLIVLGMSCLLATCQAPSITRGGFDSGSPAARTHAIEVTIKESRKTGRISRQNLKSMVELLNADDDLVRFMAINGLTVISGDDLGYRFFDSRAMRFKGIQKWRAYALESNGTDDISIEPRVSTKNDTESGS